MKRTTNELEIPKNSNIENLRNQASELIKNVSEKNKIIEIELNPDNFKKIKKILGEEENLLEIDPVNDKFILKLNNADTEKFSKILKENEIEYKTFLVFENRMREYNTAKEGSLMLAAYDLVSDKQKRASLGKSKQLSSVSDTAITFSLTEYLNLGNNESIALAKKKMQEREQEEQKKYNENKFELPNNKTTSHQSKNRLNISNKKNN